MTTTIEPNEQKNNTPQLAPPGAGIGFFPTLMLRYFVKPFVASQTTRAESQKVFHRVNVKILKEVEGLTDEQMNRRILVPPQKGLEDSSRYWSIKMVLEHLHIVSSQMFQLINELSAGRIPEGKADTALVKPKDHHSTTQILTMFNKLVSEDFEKLNSNLENKNSKLRFHHPWFGPMKADEWYWLLGVHHGLHLKQIREIKKRLPLI